MVMNRKPHIRASMIMGPLLWLLSGCQVQAAEDYFNQQFKTQLISDISQVLLERYVYADRAQVAVNELKHRLETGYFDAIEDPQVFAYRITGILDVISDLHLWVNYHAEAIPEDYNYLEPTPEQALEQAEFMRSRNYGFEAVEVLDGNVGYIEFRDFFYEEGPSETLIAEVMTTIADSDGLIIDLRRNGGGNPDMVSLFLSYLLPLDTPIGSLQYRNPRKTESYRTLSSIDGPHYGDDRPVILLLGDRTFSAAEAFSYTLQARGRAVLVGERTNGGAHPFDNVRLHAHYMMAVPVARSIDAVTGSNWQYIGVRPDHETAADDALNVALDLLLN